MVTRQLFESFKSFKSFKGFKGFKGFREHTSPTPAFYLLPVLAVTALAGCASQPAADRQTLSDTATGCIAVTRIMSTDVLDERTIVFEMNNGDIYRNSLPQRCGGLSDRDAFMYRIPSTQLCRSDIITVLQRTGPAGGTGFMPTNSCALGSFEQISEEELETLRSVE